MGLFGSCQVECVHNLIVIPLTLFAIQMLLLIKTFEQVNAMFIFISCWPKSIIMSIFLIIMTLMICI